MGQRRYPGASPFRGDQAKIFYGRDRDIEKMLTLIQVEKKVLLYSKSGLGKTSLLEAGVIPRLPSRFIPISIRFFASSSDSVSPVQRVINALEKAIGKFDTLPETIIDHLHKDEKSDQSLWYYFKKLQLAGLSKDDDDNKKIFLLVFDQFEELFSYPKEVVSEFKNQFYELSEQNVPDRYAALIAASRRNNKELFTREAIGLLHKRIDVKTVFAIRSDRLSLLNNLSDKITDIQHVYHEIKSLDTSQARQAVVNPAQDIDPSFETKPYKFHNDAIDKIINELSDNGRQSIETTQLQIVCHRIEAIAEEKSKAPGAGNNIEIEVNDLPEFKNIFLNFYNDSINKLPTHDQPNAKRLIEDELIRSKQRISLDENICREYIDEFQLKALVDTHLLRAEQNSFGRFSFELSHDTLVEPILESQKTYRDQQEKKRLEEERTEELRKLKEKQEQEKLEREEELKRMREKEVERLQKIKQQKKINIIVFTLMIVAVAFAIFGFWNYFIAIDKTEIAEQKEKQANEALQQLKISNFGRNFDDGNDLKNDTLYNEAILKYRIALQFNDTLSKPKYDSLLSLSLDRYLNALSQINFPDTANVVDLILDCKRRMENKDEYEKLYAEANALFGKKEYVAALKKYIKAHETNYANLNSLISRKYKIAITTCNNDLDDYKIDGILPDQAMWDITKSRMDSLNLVYKNFYR